MDQREERFLPRLRSGDVEFERGLQTADQPLDIHSDGRANATGQFARGESFGPCTIDGRANDIALRRGTLRLAHQQAVLEFVAAIRPFARWEGIRD